MNDKKRLTRLLGFAGSAMGLLAGVALGSTRLGLINVNPGVEPRPSPSVELAGNLSFLLACSMPFALALIALLFHNPAWRAAIWLGSVGIGVLLIPLVGARVLPAAGMNLLELDLGWTILFIMVALAIVDAVLLIAAMQRFQRARLILG